MFREEEIGILNLKVYKKSSNMFNLSQTELQQKFIDNI